MVRVSLFRFVCVVCGLWFVIMEMYVLGNTGVCVCLFLQIMVQYKYSFSFDCKRRRSVSVSNVFKLFILSRAPTTKKFYRLC